VVISLIKLPGLLKVPAKWLYKLVVDQTGIELSGQHPHTMQANSLLVPDDLTGEGLLLFGITTTSRRPIEIVKVTVDYSTPLQLLDPNQLGFFQTASSNDDDLPFRIFCEGSFQLHSKMVHAFALTAQFPHGVRELPARISVHARTLSSSAGGFQSYGRTQISKFFYRIVLSDYPLLGLAILPKHSATSSQPFLIQSAVSASGVAGSAVLVHEQLKDGTVSSKIIELPDDQQGIQTDVTSSRLASREKP
jgi:hypothetical protein